MAAGLDSFLNYFVERKSLEIGLSLQLIRRRYGLPADELRKDFLFISIRNVYVPRGWIVSDCFFGCLCAFCGSCCGSFSVHEARVNEHVYKRS